MFGRRRQAAVRAYAAFMARSEGADYAGLQTFGQLVKGDEEFATRILEQSGEPEVVRRGLTVDRVARAVAQVLALKVEDLRSARRSRDLSSARAMAEYVGRELGRISLSRMAENFRRDR